jgi:CMP-N-acetylneuraminic acid synthetase
LAQLKIQPSENSTFSVALEPVLLHTLPSLIGLVLTASSTPPMREEARLRNAAWIFFGDQKSSVILACSMI